MCEGLMYCVGVYDGYIEVVKYGGDGGFVYVYGVGEFESRRRARYDDVCVIMSV